MKFCYACGLMSAIRCQSLSTTEEPKGNQSWYKYQREITGADLSSVRMHENFRLIVGQTVTIRLPSYNKTGEVIWAFRTESTKQQSWRKFQFSCTRGNLCRTTFDLEGRTLIAHDRFTINNLQLSNAGYWVFMTSNENHEFTLLDSGSYVEIWPENMRLISHWTIPDFGDEHAICQASARPPPLMSWHQKELEAQTNRTVTNIISVTKENAEKYLPPGKNLLTCSLSDDIDWDMDTLSERKKTSSIYLSRPKWPEITAKIPNSENLYTTSIRLGKSKTFHIPNIPSTLSSVTLLLYDYLKATAPKPTRIEFGKANSIRNFGQVVINFDATKQIVSLEITNISQAGRYHFRLKFYNSLKYYIGETIVYEFAVYNSDSDVQPVIMRFSPRIFEDGNFYLLALCTQQNAYPTGDLQLITRNVATGKTTQLSAKSRHNELPLYLDIKTLQSVSGSSLECVQYKNNEIVHTTNIEIGKIEIVCIPNNTTLDLKATLNAYECSFWFNDGKSDIIPSCRLYGALGNNAYDLLVNSTKISKNEYTCNFVDNFDQDHNLTCQVIVDGLKQTPESSNSFMSDNSNTNIWIIIGSCLGILFTVLIIFLVMYCKRKRQTEKRTLTKSEISYPNSLVTGHAVAAMQNTMNSSYTSYHSHKAVVVHTDLGPSESDSEDEVAQLKHGIHVRSKLVGNSSSESDSEVDQYYQEGRQAETAVFVPRISAREFQRNDSPQTSENGRNYGNDFQESLLI